MSKIRVWTDVETVEVDVNEDGALLPELVAALRFKAANIKAKADPEVFSAAADVIEAFIGYPERAEKHFVEKHIKHGHWIETVSEYDLWNSRKYICSLCDGPAPYGWSGLEYPADWCPHCGAQMDDKAD